MNWHKEFTEKVLRYMGISDYGGMWISFFEGCVIGGAVVYYFITF